MVLNARRAKQVMGRHGVEAAVAISPTNVTYVADFSGILHFEYAEHIFALVRRDCPEDMNVVLPMGEARDLISDIDAGLSSFKVGAIRPYGTYLIYRRNGAKLDSVERETLQMINEAKSADAIQTLIDTLTELGLTRGKVAVDDANLPMTDFESVKSRVGKSIDGIEIVRGSQVFREIRAVKTPEEVERLRRAATITEGAFEEAMAVAEEGSSAEKLLHHMMCYAIDRGCTLKTPMYTTLAFGRKSYLQNVMHPALQKLKRGDLIRYDGGFPYKFYSADVARNAVLGRPSERQKRLYDAVYAGEQAIIDNAKPGVKASDLFRTASETIQKGWIPDFKRAHCGHSIGIDTYDGIMISANDDTVLEEGMVLNPETPYDEFGVGKFHVEDPILVTKSGGRLLTKGKRGLLQI